MMRCSSGCTRSFARSSKAARARVRQQAQTQEELRGTERHLLMLRQERAHTHCSRPRPRRTQQRAAATRRELRRWLRLRLRLRPCTAVRAPRRASSRAERGRSQCACRSAPRPRLLSLSAHVPRASSSFPLPIALAHTHPHSPNLFLNLSQLPQGVRRRGERGRRQVGVDPRQIKVEGDAEARAGTRAAAWLASDAAPPREEARACAEAERNEAAHEARRLGRGLPRSRDEDVVALVSRESSLTALARVLLF